MIVSVVHRLLCRWVGVACSTERPSTHDLKREMQERGRRVEAHTVELRIRRRRRDFLERALTNTEDRR